MRVKYFADTDTVLVELPDQPPVETRELSGTMYMDLDEQGRVVSLTVEHAQQAAQMEEFSCQLVQATTAAA